MDLNRLACPCCGKSECTPALVAAIDTLESIAGPQKMTSGYRCKEHQSVLRLAWVRGKMEWDKTHPGKKYPKPEPALHSQHSTGNAIDVLCADEDQAELIAAAKRAGFRGIGIGHGMLHFDVRQAETTWHY